MEFVKGAEKTKYRNGKSSIEVSEEVMVDSQMITFPTRSFSPFFEICQDRIQRLVEAGIRPQRVAGRMVTAEENESLFDEEIPALVLSMEDLGIGFEVCLIPVALSVLVFVFEVLYSEAKQVANEYLFAVFAVSAFIRTYKPGI